MNSKKQFAKAEREIHKAASTVTNAIESLFDRTSVLASVAPDYVARRFLHTLIRDYVRKAIAPRRAAGRRYASAQQCAARLL